ncbi:hypothetical protein [Hansschlegelia sp.]|uniref:hypothetical protein n=1 Tax=Hansschlegelia sp. TaxID=2041892 RepID=UPI002BFBDBF9|nr:hypothetical protein [Hansschlegelia sp.]HVI28677.1 hypothetical protein [Hansschlegelia sp.]
MAVSIPLLYAVAACDDVSTERTEGVQPLRRASPDAEGDWLQVGDAISPSEWLARRETGGDSAALGEAARRMQAVLATADQRFYEGRRMIANRAVQLEEMLKENGVHEDARTIIEQLSSIAPDGEHAGFGETGQHYVTARLQGASRDDALALLKRKGLPGPSAGDER